MGQWAGNLSAKKGQSMEMGGFIKDREDNFRVEQEEQSSHSQEKQEKMVFSHLKESIVISWLLKGLFSYEMSKCIVFIIWGIYTSSSNSILWWDQQKEQ